MAHARDPAGSKAGISGQPRQHAAAAGAAEDALKAFDKAVQLRPDDADLWKDLGGGLAELRRTDEALLTFQHALKLKPVTGTRPIAADSCCANWDGSEEALSYFNLVDQLKPNQHVVLELRALVLHGLKRYEEALADNYRAYELNPGNADTCNNIGASLQFLSRDEEALPWFDRAIALRPDYVLAMHEQSILAAANCTGSTKRKRSTINQDASIPAMPRRTGTCRCSIC